MAAPATPPATKRIELSVTDARMRFLHLMRLTRVTKQVTVIVENGHPVAAIVPPDMLAERPGDPPGTEAGAAGWVQRVEKVREDLRRQHAAHTAELLRALEEAWAVVDSLRPPGADRQVDAVRTAHAALRR